MITYKVIRLTQMLAHTQANTPTTQPSSMGMPLDIDLACSNHASYNCGLLAFGLPSASNKLSQPDPSDVQLSTQMHRESEGVGTQTLSDPREEMEI